MSTDSNPLGYDDAVFLSYTHIDNQPFGPDQLCWISHLHEQLSNRVEQLFGGHATVWRDHKLHGNDVFAVSLLDRLSAVAVMVSVCSPRYLHSEWCRRELDEFVARAEAGAGIMVGSKSRVFNVLKTPVPLDELPRPLSSLLGYEFYEESPVDHRVREYLLNPDPEARWKFYARVDDLAQDIAGLLHELSEESQRERAPSPVQSIYLAETTSDVAPHRDNVKREFERRGYRVLPRQPLPLAAEALAGAVLDDLSQADLSIHLMGARYGARPENEDRSIPHLQLDLAGQAATRGDLVQLIWIPESLQPVDRAQATLVAGLHTASIGDHVELVRAPLEAFKAHVLDHLEPAPPRTQPVVPRDGKRVYLVHDRGDRDAIGGLKAELERHGHVVMLPLGEGSEAEAREVHETSMVLGDAVLIFYGTATEHWVRMKLLDLLKAPGWGRRLPFLATAVWVAEPVTASKIGYSTSEALVIDATASAAPATLAPFLAQLASAETER